MFKFHKGYTNITFKYTWVLFGVLALNEVLK